MRFVVLSVPPACLLSPSHKHTYICTHTHTHTYTHIYTHTHIHIYIHTQKHKHLFPLLTTSPLQTSISLTHLTNLSFRFSYPFINRPRAVRPFVIRSRLLCTTFDEGPRCHWHLPRYRQQHIVFSRT